MADIPRRIQRRRTKGWRMPVGAIYVGRRYSVIGSGKWSNPFFIGGYFKRGDLVGDYRGPFRMLYSQRGIWRPEDIEAALCEGYTLIETAEQAVEWYQWYVSTWSAEFIAACKAELEGRDLACWCPLDQPCHADILLGIANV